MKSGSFEFLERSVFLCVFTILDNMCLLVLFAVSAVLENSLKGVQASAAHTSSSGPYHVLSIQQSHISDSF